MHPIRIRVKNPRIRRTVKAAAVLALILFTAVAAAGFLTVDASAEEIAGDMPVTTETEPEALSDIEADPDEAVEPSGETTPAETLPPAGITTSDADLNTDISIKRNLAERNRMMAAAAAVLAVSILILILPGRIEKIRNERTNHIRQRNGGTDE